MTTTMRASVMTGVGTLQIEERPVPSPGPHEVLVEVAAVGVCGSDVHYYRHGRIGDFVVEEPMILGHELSGRITAVGAQVDPDRVGQRVAVEPQFPCRRCRQCTAGRYNMCPHMKFYATPPVDGAFCSYVTIDAEMAHPVPDSMSDEAAALLEPLSVAIATMRKANVVPGSSILITGAGPSVRRASWCPTRWCPVANGCCTSAPPRCSIPPPTTWPRSILRWTRSSTPVGPRRRWSAV
jgi:L-iditol 2-dehydrogenase